MCFSSVQGFTPPSCQTVTVTAGQTTTVTGTFAQRGFLHVTTNPAVDAEISVIPPGGTNPIPMDDYGAWTDVPTGSYSVCFGAVAGFTPPACQPATVKIPTTTATSSTSASG